MGADDRCLPGLGMVPHRGKAGASFGVGVDEMGRDGYVQRAHSLSRQQQMAARECACVCECAFGLDWD